MSQLTELKRTLRTYINPEKATSLPRFFKTGKGQYGEGDKFLGIIIPNIRLLVHQFQDLSLADADILLQSPFHEERMVALLLLVHKYKRATAEEKKSIYEFYLSHLQNINNWDLVDLSAPHIVGNYLIGKDTSILAKLARSTSLWERRVGIIATFAFIQQGSTEETLKIATILLHDPHDLIHKAVGWMLREVGKRCSQEKEEVFLRNYYKTMPRTMLRYAIERFPEEIRIKYLKGQI